MPVASRDGTPGSHATRSPEEGDVMANIIEVLGRFLDNKRASYVELRAAWDELVQPLPAKEVNWEVVRNIANQLTNQLLDLAEGVNLDQAHISDFGGGARRHVQRTFGHSPAWRDAGTMGGWEAFNEEDVELIRWESISSGNVLRAVRLATGKWNLQYFPGKSDPTYRGFYFRLYDHPEAVKNLGAPATTSSQPENLLMPLPRQADPELKPIYPPGYTPKQ